MIKIAGYNFDGPYESTGSILNNASGVYVILDGPRNQNTYSILDVGQSETMKERIDYHDRKNCWVRNSQININYAVRYMPGSSPTQRNSIEQNIRNTYNPPCGQF